MKSTLPLAWAIAAVGIAPACQAGATDSPQALMRAAFPGWTPGRLHVIDLPADANDPPAPRRVAVTPGLVIPLGAERRVLVVAGTPADDSGRPNASHASEGQLGLYGFTRHRGRWKKTSAQPTLAWTGFSGEAGQLRAVSLGPGHRALAVENGSCWQGSCGSWLHLFEVTATGGRPLLSLALRSEANEIVDGCTAWLKPGSRAPTPEGASEDNCFAVQGRWQPRSVAGRDWADIVVRFSGSETASVEGKIRRRSVNETLVLRHDGSAYVPIGGRNPNHDL